MLKKDKLPKFDGNIILMFPKSVTGSQITNLLGKEVDIQVFDDMIEATYMEVKDFCCWEVDELLTKLFSLCDSEILLLAESKYDAKVLVDIVFYHYEKFPALAFTGANMEYIHMIKAEISIDPY